MNWCCNSTVDLNAAPQQAQPGKGRGFWKGASLLDRLVHGYVFSELSLATPKFNPELSENM